MMKVTDWQVLANLVEMDDNEEEEKDEKAGAGAGRIVPFVSRFFISFHFINN